MFTENVTRAKRENEGGRHDASKVSTNDDSRSMIFFCTIEKNSIIKRVAFVVEKLEMTFSKFDRASQAFSYLFDVS